ncbi:hypothetical protein [Kitasatospora sp. NPDC101183]|uniref:hypothetical protein n=1 Tax=Kitasatospora sp. NPDC101183 TaxID=3364100 RepID=UPI0037F26997
MSRPGPPWDEDRLRELLHQAVPPLETPDDRVRQVLARAGRTRRRRRAAGLGGGLGAGLLAAVLAAAPAIAPPPGSGAAEPGARPTARAEPLTATVFPVYDLTVDLPPGWHARSVAADPDDAIGHLANLPFDPHSSCPANVGSCSPIGPLPADGAVLTVRFTKGQQEGGATLAPDGPSEMQLDKDCSTRGGSRELVGHRLVGRSEKGGLIEITACLKEPGERTLRQVRQVLDSVRAASATDGAAVAEQG